MTEYEKALIKEIMIEAEESGSERIKCLCKVLLESLNKTSEICPER